MQEIIKKLLTKGVIDSLDYEETDTLKKAYVDIPKEQRDQMHFILLKDELERIGYHAPDGMPECRIIDGIADVNEAQDRILKRLNVLIALLISIAILFLSVVIIQLWGKW